MGEKSEIFIIILFMGNEKKIEETEKKPILLLVHSSSLPLSPSLSTTDFNEPTQIHFRKEFEI
jgi:hypothetical protein